MNRKHFFFTNPKYSTNYLCIPIGENSFGVFEKMHKVDWWVVATGTPLAKGVDATTAIESAVELGIRAYDIETVAGVQQ